MRDEVRGTGYEGRVTRDEERRATDGTRDTEYEILLRRVS